MREFIVVFSKISPREDPRGPSVIMVIYERNSPFVRLTLKPGIKKLFGKKKSCSTGGGESKRIRFRVAGI